MMVMIWGFNIAGPRLMAACVICTTLLYLEAVFGICVGCKLYPLVMRRAVSHCPGGVCTIPSRRDPMTRARKTEIAPGLDLRPRMSTIGGMPQLHARQK